LMGKGNKTSDFTIKEIAIYFFLLNLQLRIYYKKQS
jgi:hypothetical protein